MAGEGKSGRRDALGRRVLHSTMQWIVLIRQSLGSAALMLVAASARAQTPSPIDTATLRRVLATEGIPVSSVGDIHQTRRHILIDTHINPSAGTIVVLTREMKRVTTLSGWVLRVLPTDIVLYHRNNVHFAPTHWAELWTWDPATGRDARLYPNPPADSLRRAYVDTVRSIYHRIGEEWFRANNHHMDPQRFDTRLGDTIVVAPSGRTLAFMMTFGGGEGTPAATPSLEVAVVCRDVGAARSRCREHSAAALARAHLRWTQNQLLDDLVSSRR